MIFQYPNPAAMLRNHHISKMWYSNSLDDLHPIRITVGFPCTLFLIFITLDALGRTRRPIGLEPQRQWVAPPAPGLMRMPLRGEPGYDKPTFQVVPKLARKFAHRRNTALLTDESDNRWRFTLPAGLSDKADESSRDSFLALICLEIIIFCLEPLRTVYPIVSHCSA